MSESKPRYACACGQVVGRSALASRKACPLCCTRVVDHDHIGAKHIAVRHISDVLVSIEDALKYVTYLVSLKQEGSLRDIQAIRWSKDKPMEVEMVLAKPAHFVSLTVDLPSPEEEP